MECRERTDFLSPFSSNIPVLYLEFGEDVASFQETCLCYRQAERMRNRQMKRQMDK